MYSLLEPRLILGVYFVVCLITVPLIRVVMIAEGAKGFSPWREFWGKRAVSLLHTIIIVGLLWWGGFWG